MDVSGYGLIGVGEAEERFGVSADVEYRFAEFAERQEVRLYEGGLRVAGDLRADSHTDDPSWCAFNVIVDGDLTVDGGLDWFDHSHGSFLLVTGSLHAGNVLLDGCPTVVVRGDLIVGNAVYAHRGEYVRPIGRGRLVVRGVAQARTVIAIGDLPMVFAERPKVEVVIADQAQMNWPVDFGSLDVLRQKLHGADGGVEHHMLRSAVWTGERILRNAITPGRTAAATRLTPLLADAAGVTELDLSGLRLTHVPDELFAFANLRRLSLADNDLDVLPDRIGELSRLEELDLSRSGLRRLPAAIGRLSNLRILDISGRETGWVGPPELECLPDELGDLARLSVLRARWLSCPLPASLSRLAALAEVDLTGLRGPRPSTEEAGYRAAVMVAFPRAVLALPALRKLVLAHTPLSSIPDELAALASLEELHLNGCLSFITRLPNLASLPRLRVLHLSGDGKPTPPRDLLDVVWPITTLEELDVSGWGASTEDLRYNPQTKQRVPARPALTALPDDAFARMPHLRRLDLSRNELTVLPASFQQLRHIESVNVDGTGLPSRTTATATQPPSAAIGFLAHVDAIEALIRADPVIGDDGDWVVDEIRDCLNQWDGQDLPDLFDLTEARKVAYGLARTVTTAPGFTPEPLRQEDEMEARWGYPDTDREFTVVAGDLHVDGPIDMYENSGLIVLGDLHAGSVGTHESTGYVIVAGDLRARTVWCGADLLVAGDVETKLAVGYHIADIFGVGGTLRARLAVFNKPWWRARTTAVERLITTGSPSELVAQVAAVVPEQFLPDRTTLDTSVWGDDIADWLDTLHQHVVNGSDPLAAQSTLG